MTTATAQPGQGPGAGPAPTATAEPRCEGDFDMVVVGAGFGGLYMLHKARQLGFTVRVIDKAGDVGGVWYWNRYPGARCDVESMQYSFGFDDALQQQWRWSERFAAQPEILAYATHVAQRYDLRRDIRFNTGVTAARYDEAQARWQVVTDRGEQCSARFLVMATGCLSAARLPDIPGLASFAGRTLHTGHWPHEPVDFTGLRVGVIGTGSSGIQAIPEIARQAAQLVVFQRTANFSIPARNAPMDDTYERQWKDHYPALRERAKADTTSGTLYDKSTRKAVDVSADEREAEYQRRWAKGGVNFMHAFTDLMVDARSNATAAYFVRGQIRATVNDPAVAGLLAPTDHPIGSKRICIDSGYFATYNRPNVRLVSLKHSPIARISAAAVHTRDEAIPLDMLVLATGYDAMTGALLNIDITGRAGLRLADAWQAGPRTHLGLMVAGFPNLFTITGPGSPSVLSNMIFAIEQHVDWVSGLLAHLQRQGLASVEAEPQAQDDWVDHVNQLGQGTLFVQANSWYMGANVPGKPRVFMPYAGGVVAYRQHCDRVAASGYTGFRFSQGPGECQGQGQGQPAAARAAHAAAHPAPSPPTHAQESA